MNPRYFGSGTTRSGLWLLVFSVPLLTAVPSSALGEPLRGEVLELRFDRYGDALPPAASARLGTVRLRNNYNGWQVVISPDGQLVASDGSPVRVWHPATGREIDRFRGKIYSGPIAFSPDGRILLAVVPGGLQHWNTATGELVRELPIGETDRVGRGRAFSADGQFLALNMAEEGTTGLWETATGKQRALVRHGRSDTEQVAVSPDGGLLALAGWNDLVHVWDVAAGKERFQLQATDDRLSPLHFSPDGKRIAAATGKGLQLWDAVTGKRLLEMAEPGYASSRSFAFSADGSRIAVDSKGAIHLRDAATGNVLRRFVGHRGWYIASLALSPDGLLLASTSEDRTIGLWNVATGKPLHHFEGHQGGVVCLAFSPDGRQLASGGDMDETVIVWDLATRKPLSFFTGHSRGARSVAYAPDGKLLATGDGHPSGSKGDEAASVRLYALPEGRLGRPFAAHSSNVASLALSPDGKRMATTGGDGMTRLWEVSTGKGLHQLRGADGQHRSIAFSPDGKALLTAGTSGELALWRVDTGEKVRDFGPQGSVQRRVQWAAFSNSGKVLISQETRHVGAGVETPPGTFFWDVATGRLLRDLKIFCAHEGTVRAALSPDGKLLAVCMGSHGILGPIHLYDVDSGRLRFQLRGHQGEIRTLAISPDGKTLASGGADTTVLLWDVSPLRLALEELWTEERAGPADAVKLARKLAASQGEVVLFLEQYLQQLAARETSYEGLIVDLNSVRFEVRERAARKLEELGPDAEPALRLALREAPSPQARLTIEGLLERPVERLRRLFADTESNDKKVWRKAWQGVRMLRPEDEPVLRRLREESTEVRIRGRIDAVLNQPKALGEMPAPSRARSASLSVAILEEFATPEARRVLRGLALGPVKSIVTREAKTALERLENLDTKR